MKIIGIVGSNAWNFRTTVCYYNLSKKIHIHLEFEILEIKDIIPMFNQDEDQSRSFLVQYMYNKLIRADGVIIATPEHNHNYSCVELIEWITFNLHPFENKL